MKRPENFDAVVFNHSYNICPRFPDGTKWEVHANGNRCSATWNMVTFDDAVAYLRQQYAHAVKAARHPQHPGDQYAVTEFSGWIDGPGGRMEWNTVRPLVGA